MTPLTSPRPAIRAGGLVATVNDIVGILIYSSFATLFHRFLVS